MTYPLANRAVYAPLDGIPRRARASVNRIPKVAEYQPPPPGTARFLPPTAARGPPPCRPRQPRRAYTFSVGLFLFSRSCLRRRHVSVVKRHFGLARGRHLLQDCALGRPRRDLSRSCPSRGTAPAFLRALTRSEQLSLPHVHLLNSVRLKTVSLSHGTSDGGFGQRDVRTHGGAAKRVASLPLLLGGRYRLVVSAVGQSRRGQRRHVYFLYRQQ